VSQPPARDVPARGLPLGAVGGLSWCPGPSAEGARLRRERSLPQSCARSVTALAARASPGARGCASRGHSSGASAAPGAASGSSRLRKAREAPRRARRLRRTLVIRKIRSPLRRAPWPCTFGPLLEPPPAQRPPPRLNGRRHCARNSAHTAGALAPAPAAAPGCQQGARPVTRPARPE
jgi:hypothetical protein